MSGSEPRPPSVDALARVARADSGLPHPLLVDAARAAIAAGDPDAAAAGPTRSSGALLRPVVNATGVLLHTNLGRAPLAVAPTTPATRNLELDLATGRRGSRHDHAGRAAGPGVRRRGRARRQQRRRRRAARAGRARRAAARVVVSAGASWSRSAAASASPR